MKETSKTPSKGAVILFGILDVVLASALAWMLLSSGTDTASQDAVQTGEEGQTLLTYAEYSQIDHESSVISNVSMNYQSSQASETSTSSQADAQAGTSSASSNTSSASSGTSSSSSMYEGFIFPSSDTVLLTQSDIVSNITSSDQALRAINEIYARHGYQFNLEENIAFFSQYDWYVNMSKTSDMSAVAAQFNSVESANVNALVDYQTSKGWR